MKRIISPSMLSADFGNLERDTRMIDRSRAEWVHIDVMDGVFVPNISFGFPVMKPIRQATSKVLDVHLMIIEPEKYVEQFVKAGADYVTFHVEATEQADKCIELIHAAGAKAGVSIKPATPTSVIKELLPKVELVLVMSVEPGFGGQSFMPISIDKVKELAAMREEMGLDFIIEVDGGINNVTGSQCVRAGADILVSGSYIYNNDAYQAIQALKGKNG